MRLVLELLEESKLKMTHCHGRLRIALREVRLLGGRRDAGHAGLGGVGVGVVEN